MAKGVRHKGLEFAVDDAGGRERIFKDFDEACGFALRISVSNGQAVNLDVLCYSKAGANAWGGSEGVSQYEDDPEASVFERIIVRAEATGRVA